MTRILWIFLRFLRKVINDSSVDEVFLELIPNISFFISLLDEIVEEKRGNEQNELKILLLGTKCDQIADREVQYEEGESVCQGLRHHNNIQVDFFEVSALQGTNVCLAFQALLCMYTRRPQNHHTQAVHPRRTSLSRLSLRRRKKKSTKQSVVEVFQKRNSVSDSALDRISKNEARDDEELQSWTDTWSKETLDIHSTDGSEHGSRGTSEFRCSSASPKLHQIQRGNRLDENWRKGSCFSDSEVEVMGTKSEGDLLSRSRCSSATPNLDHHHAVVTSKVSSSSSSSSSAPKHFVQRTLDSVHRFLSSSTSPTLFRSWTYDASKKRSFIR